MKTEHSIVRSSLFFGAVSAALASVALAQNEVAGDWDQSGGGIFGFQEEFIDRGGGPDLGDYAGLPINDALRYKASLYSPSWLTVPEHQCLPHPGTYAYRSPGGLSIVKEYDPATQRLVAYRFYGSYGLARTVWMDGRPHPPANARHTYEGFSTGRWEGNRLAVDTTHLKAGFLRRNGIAHSDRARMLEYWVRHDDYLTLVTAVDDPVYLDEPFVRSTDFRVDPRPNTRLAEFGGFANGGDGEGFGASDVFYKCVPTEEIAIERGKVPSFMPGANENIDMFSKRHNIPLDAALGGSATLYPEYAGRLKPGNAAPAADRSAARPPRPPFPADAPAATSLHVAGQVWLLTIGGHNVAVQVGNEGVLVVNPGPEEIADAVSEEVAKLAHGLRIRIIVDTDDDIAHIGGNAKLASGTTPREQRAAVFAHENASLRIAQAGLSDRHSPTDTFFRGTREIYFNDEPIEIIYVPAAASDGDVLVYFRKSDVIVAGSVLEDLTYPIIRTAEGGSLNGTLEALNHILDLTIAEYRAQGGTMVIPNRGRIYDEGDVAEYRDMLTIIRDRVQDAVGKGSTLAQVQGARLARDYDGRYAAATGPASANEFIATVYRGSSAK